MILEYFQMVDRIEALDPHAGTIRTTCNVPGQSPVFIGHFPGFPRLPGALMIETMAQTGGWLVLARLRFARMPFLTRVESAKLRRFVEPGETLDGAATLTHDGSGFAVIEAVISTGGQKVASAEIRYVVGPFPNDTISGAMIIKAREIGFPEECLHAERSP
ncbi:MAG TPA: 3-hydroxyacyl-ACP dehydratase FabZ family protein [Acetobacteraceae bacterium]|jgi:3-hydroxyacyl-[acyl-carrier-protein] dehydratase|nr:3-hydroxyacyl-ACP dehydratase FabZ family protein [Acetobacteraceae bacterium]